MLGMIFTLLFLLGAVFLAAGIVSVRERLNKKGQR